MSFSLALCDMPCSMFWYYGWELYIQTVWLGFRLLIIEPKLNKTHGGWKSFQNNAIVTISLKQVFFLTPWAVYCLGWSSSVLYPPLWHFCFFWILPLPSPSGICDQNHLELAESLVKSSCREGGLVAFSRTAQGRRNGIYNCSIPGGFHFSKLNLNLKRAKKSFFSFKKAKFIWAVCVLLCQTSLLGRKRTPRLLGTVTTVTALFLN